MIDYFTKAAEFAVIYDKSAASVARAFYYSWICRYFVPSHVTSDNGTEFEQEFGHLLARLGVKHINTSACHPAANGVVERLVGSFKSMLERHVNSHPVHWVQSVPVMRQQYWARVHQTLGMSPQEMVYGRQPMPVVPLLREVLAVAAASRVWVWLEDFECPYPPMHVAQLQQQ
jgi:cleavage and polyadenylation specificity factor subunit 1